MQPSAEMSIKLYNIAKTCDTTDILDDIKKAQMINTLNLLPTLKGQDLRIYPLLYKKALDYNLFDKLHGKTQALLKKSCFAASADNLRKQTFIRSIEPQLKQLNLEIILLKSAAFNGTIYCNEYPRFSVDLDILVRSEDKEKAIQLFSKTGKFIQLKKKQVFDNLYECSFEIYEQPGLLIDLHYSLTYPKLFNIDQTALFNAGRTHPSYNSPYIKTLSPEHNLIHIATNMVKDLSLRQHNLLDANEICLKSEPNIEIAFKFAKTWQAERVLHILLYESIKSLKTHIDTNITKINKGYNFSTLLGTIVFSVLNKKLAQEKSFMHRTQQALTQLCLTDKLSNALCHQCSYLKKRIAKQKLTHS